MEPIVIDSYRRHFTGEGLKMGCGRGEMASGGHLGDDLANFGFSVDTTSEFA